MRFGGRWFVMCFWCCGLGVVGFWFVDFLWVHFGFWRSGGVISGGLGSSWGLV